ncbi:YcaO-like family protein [Streptomyces sp. NPDC004561]
MPGPALLETVEREVLHRDHAAGGRSRTLVDPPSVSDPYCAELIGRFRDAGMAGDRARGNSYDIPVFAAYIRSEGYPVVFAGSGCHVLPEIALSRALTETAQSRLTCITGTRDDLDSHEAAFAAQPDKPELALLPVRLGGLPRPAGGSRTERGPAARPGCAAERRLHKAIGL